MKSELEMLRDEFPDGPGRELLERVATFTERGNALKKDFADVHEAMLADWFFSMGCQALLEIMSELEFRLRLKHVANMHPLDRGSYEQTRAFIAKKGAR